MSDSEEEVKQQQQVRPSRSTRKRTRIVESDDENDDTSATAAEPVDMMVDEEEEYEPQAVMVDEEDENEEEIVEEDDNEDDEDFGETKKKKSKKGKKKAAPVASKKKSTRNTTTKKSTPTPATKSTAGRLNFAPISISSDELFKKHEREMEALRAEQKANNKRKSDNISQADSDEDEDEEEELDEEDLEISRPTRSSTRPTRACRTKQPELITAPTPITGRRSGRAHAQVSYREPSETEGLELSASPEQPAAASKKRLRKPISVDSDEEESAEPLPDTNENDDSFFDEDDEFDGSAVQQAFTAKFLPQRTHKSESRKSKKVAVSNRKGKKKSKKRYDSDDDESESSEDSAAERLDEREWAQKQGLVYSDAEESHSEDESDEVDVGENPVDKILAKRLIRIPADPSNPNPKETINRMEFYCKYKDLSYHHCDWIDRKTIERWKNGKSRISWWLKHEQKEESNIHMYVNDKKLFQQIKENEIKVYERDEAEGTNALIDSETSRLNKRLHPNLKVIEKVWCALVIQTSDDRATVKGDEDEFDAELTARPMLFDPSYLEVDRIIGERDEENESGGEPIKQYLVKWTNLPYEHVTWEDAQTALNDYIFPEHIEKFHRSLKLPTPHELKTGEQYLGADIRPKLVVYNDKNPCPPFKDDKQLREYQLSGVNFLSIKFFEQKNVILADEMGLGKTVQTVAFLRNLISKGLRGPFLVLAPLSCTPHWQREFESWTDDLTVVSYTDSAHSRDIINTYELQWEQAMGNTITKDQKSKLRSRDMKNILRPNVIISSYQLFRQDIEFFSRVRWQVLIADEAHQVRNEQSKLYESIVNCEFAHKIFLTGTPIQNNLGELFTLLNLIDPLQFPDRPQFESKYSHLQTSGNADDVTSLQKAIQPYFFRRMKGDVEKNLPKREETLIEVEMTSQQKQFYRAVFESNLDFLRGPNSKAKSNLMNVSMQLRLVTCHPFLLPGVEDKVILDNNLVNEDEQMQHVLQLSGKFVLLDKLLTKLHGQGSKVLIFSQFVKVLDLVEDFLNWRGWKHERLDGSTAARQRQISIDRFSKPGSDRFVFMLSTKAGGVGINLTAADTIIIFDSDWNPQGDVQAMARAHRIGQTKTVKVYRLICAGTYESELFEKASLKLGLDQAVLHTMKENEVNKNLDKKEIEGLLRKGAAWMIKDKDDDSKAQSFCAADIDTILEKNTRTINSESEVGAASARSGLGSFTQVTFTSTEVGGVSISVDDPDFWEKLAKTTNMDTNAAKKKLQLEQKRQHKQMYDLSKATGRAASEFDGNEDYEGALGSDDESDAGSIDSDTLMPKKKKRAPKKRSFDLDDGEDVEFSEPDEDENEKYYSGAFSKRQSVRFLHALQSYGYNRLDELLPYFPNQSMRDLQKLAIGYIIKLSQSCGDAKKIKVASVLYGAIRNDLLALLKSEVVAKSSVPINLDSKDWPDLFDLFPVEPTLADPKLAKKPHFQQYKRVLTDLNRLSVLYYTIKASEIKHQTKSEDGEPELIFTGNTIIPPKREEVETNQYVKLPHTLHPIELPFVDSNKDHLPADWWQPQLHDHHLLSGIHALGFQHYVAAKDKNLFDRLKKLPGLPFFNMIFGKATRKRKSTTPADEKQEETKEKEIDENSRSSDTKEEDPQPDPSNPVTDATTTIPTDADVTMEDVAQPTVSDSATESATTAVSATSAPPTPAPVAPEKPVWPGLHKLKARFGRLLDMVEKERKSSLPSLVDYYKKQTNRLMLGATTKSSKSKPSATNTIDNHANSAAPPITVDDVKSISMDDDIDLSSPEPLENRLMAPTWKLTYVRNVIKALTAFGEPTEQTLQLPSEYFESSTAAPIIPIKQEVIEESKSGETVTMMEIDDDLVKVDVTQDAPSPASAHFIFDDYKQFLRHCSLKTGGTILPTHVKKLVDEILSKAKIAVKQVEVKKKKEKGEEKEDKKDEKEKKKSAENMTLEEMLAAELTPKKAKNLMDRIELVRGIKTLLQKEGVNLQQSLSTRSFKSPPFPSFQSRIDDASLLVGIIKHGLGHWNSMREDPLLTVFKLLKPEEVKSKAKVDKKEEKKEETSGDQTPMDTTTDELNQTTASEDGVKVEGEKKTNEKVEKAPTMRYDYQESKLIERLKNILLSFKPTTLTNQSTHEPPSPKKSKVTSSSNVHKTSPTKAHQQSLGPAFGVEAQTILTPPPHKPTGAGFGSKKKDDSNKENKDVNKSSPIKSKHDQSSPIKKEKKTNESGQTTPSKDKESKPKKLSPIKPPQPTNFIPLDVEDIDDDFDLVSPDAVKPVKKSTNPSKKQRTLSPIRAPTSGLSHLTSPIRLPQPPQSIALLSSSSDDSFGSLDSPDEPPAKKLKAEDGSPIAKVQVKEATKATTTTASAKLNPTASISKPSSTITSKPTTSTATPVTATKPKSINVPSSSSKKDGGSSHKKPTPEIASKQITSFFNKTPMKTTSIATIQANTSPNNLQTQPTASSASKKPHEDEIIDLE